MNSNRMWHIERMGDVLRHLRLPWFYAEVYHSGLMISVLGEDDVTLYSEMCEWNYEEDEA